MPILPDIAMQNEEAGITTLKWSQSETQGQDAVLGKRTNNKNIKSKYTFKIDPTNGVTSNCYRKQHMTFMQMRLLSNGNA